MAIAAFPPPHPPRTNDECVIAILSATMAKTVVDVRTSLGCNVDKFAAVGLTQLPGEHVAAPLIEECSANLGCNVIDRQVMSQHNQDDP
jgi:flavin reductase (DIM6/NTAB) family NADH-FMN oxidoreductase RutF